MPLASALLPLSAAIDAYVARNPKAASALTTEKLIKVVTDDDPRLLFPFRDYVLRTRVDGRNSSVLVCSAELEAIVEDAGCTGPSDLPLWNNRPRRQCVFSLDLAEACRSSVP